MSKNTKLNNGILEKCYHQSMTTYDEFEDEKGKTFYEDFEVCNECSMVIFQGKEMGLSK